MGSSSEYVSLCATQASPRTWPKTFKGLESLNTDLLHPAAATTMTTLGVRILYNV